MNDMKQFEITRATVVMDNMPVKTYDVKDVIDKADMHAYKERIKTLYAQETGVMDVDLVYKEIDA